MWPFRPRWEDYCKLCICQVVRDKIVGEMVLKYDVTGAWSVCVCVCIYIYILVGLQKLVVVAIPLYILSALELKVTG